MVSLNNIYSDKHNINEIIIPVQSYIARIQLLEYVYIFMYKECTRNVVKINTELIEKEAVITNNCLATVDLAVEQAYILIGLTK